LGEVITIILFSMLSLGNYNIEIKNS
jgi:hypothetical protein